MLTALLTASLVAVAAPAADGPAKVFPAAEAKDHVGETLTFEMTVASSKDGVHRRTYFLDSEADYGSETNLAVLIDYDHAGAFKAKGIDNPAEHFKGKRVRVTGKVLDESGQTRIRVTDPARIEVVSGAKP